MQELVQAARYPLQEHFVTTADGYVLGVYRIPYGSAQSPDTKSGPPVLLQHGLLDSSATWVVNFPSQSLGFILADAGYDVWLSNSRGNAFSRNHTGFPPESAEFWDFSFDDMADYDITAVIHYISTNTDPRYGGKIAYIGHSQGTTQAFAAFSAHPELQKSVSLFAALGPVTYTRYISSLPMILLAQLKADQVFNVFGQYEFLPARKSTSDLFSKVCETSPLTCVSVLTAICGFNEHNLNTSRLATYVAYAPSGTSVKNMAHWAQLVRQTAEQRTWLFRRYDYGQECTTPRGKPQNCNQRIYGTDQPPNFDLSKLDNVPIALFSGVQDKLADPVDVEALIEALPPRSIVYSQSEVSYEHIDFTWGLSSAEKIYPHVLWLLKEYHHSSYL